MSTVMGFLACLSIGFALISGAQKEVAPGLLTLGLAIACQVAAIFLVTKGGAP